MKSARILCAMLLPILVGCEQDPSSPTRSGDAVVLSARFQAGTTVPRVDSIEAKLVRPGLDSEVQTLSYAVAKGTYLKFRSIAVDDSFQLTLAGFDHVGAERVVRWWTTQGGTARQSPIQAVSLDTIDSLPDPRSAITPPSLATGAVLTLPGPGTWHYTTDGSDPRTSAMSLVASATLTVSTAGTVCLANSRQSTNGPLLWSDTACWSFTGLDTSRFMADRAGKVYPVAHIGTQKWMAANLDWIPEGSDSSWCFGDSPSNCGLYGRLYAWSQASVSCPSGWHLPSRVEWATLVGSHPTEDLKATTSWPAGATGTDATRFAVLPGNSRFDGGYDFYGLGADVDARFWSSSSASNPANAYSITIPLSNAATVGVTTYGKQNGFSVRCLAD